MAAALVLAATTGSEGKKSERLEEYNTDDQVQSGPRQGLNLVAAF